MVPLLEMADHQWHLGNWWPVTTITYISLECSSCKDCGITSTMTRYLKYHMNSDHEKKNRKNSWEGKATRAGKGPYVTSVLSSHIGAKNLCMLLTMHYCNSDVECWLLWYIMMIKSSQIWGPTIYVWEIEQQQGMNGILRSSLTRILRSSSILLKCSRCRESYNNIPIAGRPPLRLLILSTHYVDSWRLRPW